MVTLTYGDETDVSACTGRCRADPRGTRGGRTRLTKVKQWTSWRRSAAIATTNRLAPVTHLVADPAAYQAFSLCAQDRFDVPRKKEWKTYMKYFIVRTNVMPFKV